VKGCISLDRAPSVSFHTKSDIKSIVNQCYGVVRALHVISLTGEDGIPNPLQESDQCIATRMHLYKFQLQQAQ
jgi:hypothetical protein